MAQSTSGKNNERRVFRLGYVQSTDFPYLNDCFFRSFPLERDCRMPGISGEAWTDIARAMNWTLRFVKAEDYGGYDPEKDGYFSGVLGMIQNGSVDGSIAFASLRPSRDQYFTFTEAPQTYENGLIIAERITTRPEILLHVFHWSVICLLSVCTICVAFYNYCAIRVSATHDQSPKNTYNAVWSAVSTALLQNKTAKPSTENLFLGLAFTVLYLTYFAGFRSQAMIVYQRRTDLTFQRFFADNEAKVIVRSYSALKPEHRIAIFGVNLPDSDPRILVEYDRHKIAQILCQNPKVAHYSRLDVFLATERVSGCIFRTLALSGNVTAIGFKGTQAYVLSKKTPKRTIEIINNILRRVYSIDQVGNYLYRKYGIREELAPTISVPQLPSQISLHQLSGGFIFLIASFATVCAVCITERVVHTCRATSHCTAQKPHSHNLSTYFLPYTAESRMAATHNGNLRTHSLVI